jgi:hypothetical protein
METVGDPAAVQTIGTVPPSAGEIHCLALVLAESDTVHEALMPRKKGPVSLDGMVSTILHPCVLQP